MDSWRRFREVTQYLPPSHRVFRSSAPNYMGSDDTQRLTSDAVEFLKETDINTIMSFNRFPYSDAELATLSNAGITYRHFPVDDFTSPSLDQLRDAYEFMLDRPGGSGILIHCGYGHGRTGTVVTGLQLHFTRGESPVVSVWPAVNGVETRGQIEVLTSLRDSLKDDQ
ncbi:phosphatases II [Rickenella mellea]|uniref:Phosphatases II n=1 Tax=Rickenella mellea TaxID=50990 RepID=A0A4Y7Q0N6_9AGAM|nr:phosphatases II [Rickenella mellea]